MSYLWLPESFEPLHVERFSHLCADIHGMVAERVHSNPTREDRCVKVEPEVDERFSTIGFVLSIDGVIVFAEGGISAQILSTMHDPHSWAVEFIDFLPNGWENAHWGIDFQSWEGGYL